LEPASTHDRSCLSRSTTPRSRSRTSSSSARGPWDYVRSHPSAPALVVEIAETSLAVDREHKSSLYARAGVADYWILNLREAVLEVYRQPMPAAAAPFSREYRSVQRLAPGASISPLAAPGARIAIADLLPPA